MTNLCDISISLIGALRMARLKTENKQQSAAPECMEEAHVIHCHLHHYSVCILPSSCVNTTPLLHLMSIMGEMLQVPLISMNP